MPPYGTVWRPPVATARRRHAAAQYEQDSAWMQDALPGRHHTVGVQPLMIWRMQRLRLQL